MSIARSSPTPEARLPRSASPNVNAAPAALGWPRACYLLAIGIPAAAFGGAELLKLAVKGLREVDTRA
jgi:hypothetical protein